MAIEDAYLPSTWSHFCFPEVHECQLWYSIVMNVNCGTLLYVYFASYRFTIKDTPVHDSPSTRFSPATFWSREGAAVAEWLSSWLAEQEVQGLIPRLATWISEIGYLLHPIRNMAEIQIKRRKSSIQPTNQPTNPITRPMGYDFAHCWFRTQESYPICIDWKCIRQALKLLLLSLLDTLTLMDFG